MTAIGDKAPKPNMEGLERTERAWRRFGAPSLRQFALIDALERKLSPRTLPGALFTQEDALRSAVAVEDVTPPSPESFVNQARSKFQARVLVDKDVVLALIKSHTELRDVCRKMGIDIDIAGSYGAALRSILAQFGYPEVLLRCLANETQPDNLGDEGHAAIEQLMVLQRRYNHQAMNIRAQLEKHGRRNPLQVIAFKFPWGFYYHQNDELLKIAEEMHRNLCTVAR